MGSKRARLAAMLAASILASAASAATVAAAPESPGTALSRHIRVLASRPQDFNALIGAGKAALELGDVQSAAGFFGRAEESYPTSPAPKAGLGAAMAHMGDADGAIFYFDQAVRLGASTLAIALDRGLARDLNGDLGAAQSDYKTAIQALNSDEARRRLALSLAIARDRDGALLAIQPLLNRRDPGAQRTRAFVLALVGDQAGAAQAIESVMPGGSARFAPFFTYLPNLSIEEKAAAVHLGIFPENPAERVAQAQSRPVPRSNQPTLSLGGPAAGSGSRTTSPPLVQAPPVKIAQSEVPVQTAPAPSFSLPSQRGSASPSFSMPSASSAPSTASNQAQTESEPAPQRDQSDVAVADTDAAGGNLSGIDKLLATIAEVPPPPTPKFELQKPDTSATKKAAADKKAADKKAAEEKKKREAKLAAEKKAREEVAKLGVKGTYWVQLAGGSNQDRLGQEYRRLATEAGSLLKSRSGYVTEGKSYFRLLVGPFDSKSESQSFVNKLAKEGVDGFSWTRTPAQIKIEKIASR